MINHELWKDWVVFKEDSSNDLKKQGSDRHNDMFQDFSTRESPLGPPSLQEYFEALLVGIKKRGSLGLYKGLYNYYLDLERGLIEHCKLINHKQRFMVELFQAFSSLQISRDPLPKIVVSCSFCNVLIYINFHCKTCYSVFYCDVSCLKNDKVRSLYRKIMKLTVRR